MPKNINEILLEIRINDIESARGLAGQLRQLFASKSVLANYDAFVYSEANDRVVLVFFGPLCRVNLTGYIVWFKGVAAGKIKLPSGRKPALQVLADFSSGKLYEEHRAGALPASRPDPFKYGKEWRKYLSNYAFVASYELFSELQEAFRAQFRTASLWITRKDTKERHRVVVIGERSFFGLKEQTAEVPAVDASIEDTHVVMQMLSEEELKAEEQKAQSAQQESEQAAKSGKRIALVVAMLLLVVAGAATAAVMLSRSKTKEQPKQQTQNIKEILHKVEDTALPEPEEVPEPQLVPLPPVRAEIAHRDIIFKKKWRRKKAKKQLKGAESTTKEREKTAGSEKQVEEEVSAQTEETKQEEKPKGPKITAAQYWKKKKELKSGKLNPEKVKAEVDPYAETGSIFLAKLKVVADNLIINKKMEKLKEIPADDPNYAVMRRKLEEEEISDVLTFQIKKRPDVLKDFGRKCEVDEVSQFLFNLAYLEYTRKKYYNHATFKRIAAAIDPSAKRAAGSGKPVLDITYFVKRCYKKNPTPENGKKLLHILIASLYYLEHVYYSYVKTKPPPRLKKVEQKVYREIEKMMIERDIQPDRAYFEEFVLSVVSFFQRYREVPLSEGPLLNKIRVECWKKPEISRYCKF